MLFFNNQLITASETPNEDVIVSGTALIYHDDPGIKLLDRVLKLESQNQRQREEMAVMKTIASEDRKEINELKSRVASLEESEADITNGPNQRLQKRPKRPYRLLPISNILLGSEKTNTEEEIRRFYGPATSCQELGNLGYTLNGYYLIKEKITNQSPRKTSRIQVVFCKFQQPNDHHGKNSVLETFIGNVGIKTKSVHFYVQRDSNMIENGFVSFPVERLNIGGAMSLTTGTFTAPVNGTYFFTFTGFKAKTAQDLFITLYLNSVYAGVVAYADSLSNWLPITLSVSLHLKMGDRVNLYKQGGILADNTQHYTHFTGWLVEEDLFLG